MPIRKSYKSVFLVLAFLALTVAVIRPVEGGCSEIQDLDDRAKCYEEKIEDKKDDYESTSKQLEDIRNKKDKVSGTIAKYLSELSVTQAQIDELQREINTIKDDLDYIKENLTDRKTKLSEKIDFRNKVIRNYSKRNIKSDLEIFFAAKPLETELTGFQYNSMSYMFNRALTDEALRLIYLLNSEIDSFERDKAETETLLGELEGTQGNLLSLKADIDNKKASAQDEFGNLENKEGEYKAELSDLQKQIDDLSSKQQEILNLKYGDENGSVGEYEAPKVETPSPPFKPAFAAFSYGAYTHYKGMSQYGARGRAEDGKSYKDIIKFYYKESVNEKDDFPNKICVEGYGEMDFQKYLYGLAEMPSSWDDEALKAQAVAGRSYAYRRTKNGSCICTTQSCQVFLKSKSDNPPDAWKDAVDDTEDKIIGGGTDAPGYGWYSSTTGGYIENVGWDVKSNWPDNAYEKRAGSPWFRKAWYTKSYNNNDTCGRSHPWLTEEEMADIINTSIVLSNGSGSEKDHVSPVTTSCWGGDPYSLDEMREKADKYGKAYKKVKSIDVDISGGKTSKVTLETDNGDISIDGQAFKDAFNLRAPSYIAIRSRIFDFEKEN
ncbi:SpoIID/LytB domain-containing protein [Patescibacteria group bacterium]